MAIQDVPYHMIVGARTGFLTALPKIPMAWQKFTNTINMGAKSMDLVDLGAAPMPVQNMSQPQVQGYIEKHLQIAPKDWEITVGISYNDVQDDQTGALERKVRSAAENFQAHINKLAFDALENGDGTTSYGACYDGQAFFSASHADKGADYSTAQSNTNALALSLANFKVVRAKAMQYRDDRGEFVVANPDLLVVHPDYEYEAAQITGNPAAYGTANRDVNPYAGKASYEMSPYITSGAWMLLASGGTNKPLILAMRENPGLQSAWFDPKAPKGGIYYFKYYGRYDFFYGDWRLATMGKS